MPANDRTSRTPPRARTRAKDWKPSFLEALQTCGVVAYAAKAAGVGRSTAYEARESDEDFRNAWDAACEEAADMLELEAIRRAVEGTAKPVYQSGKLVGAERQYSDALLMFLLKARRPRVFADQTRHEIETLTHFKLTPYGRDTPLTLERLVALADEADAQDADWKELPPGTDDAESTPAG